MSGELRGAGGGTAYVVAAGVVAVVVVVLVVVFGVERPPELPSVGDEPAEPVPSAGVAWMSWSSDGACVHTLTPDGARREAWCDRGGGELLAWRDDGTFLIERFNGGERRIHVVDPATGEVSRRGGDAGADPSDAEWVWFDTSHTDGDLVVRLEGDEVWRVPAGASYRVDDGVASPDGAWIAARDSADRILLIARDRSSPVRVWTSAADGASTLVWQTAADGG